MSFRPAAAATEAVAATATRAFRLLGRILTAIDTSITEQRDSEGCQSRKEAREGFEKLASEMTDGYIYLTPRTVQQTPATSIVDRRIFQEQGISIEQWAGTWDGEEAQQTIQGPLERGADHETKDPCLETGPWLAMRLFGPPQSSIEQIRPPRNCKRLPDSRRQSGNSSGETADRNVCFALHELSSLG